METQNKGNTILRSVFIGIGFVVIFLLIGTILDYIVTQVLSQFFLANCSENCYFRIFNFIFVIVALLSCAGGIRFGIRAYKRQSEIA